MPEVTTHAGSCHCGRVRFEVTADIKDVMACNCSHCSRKGFLLIFAPPSRFALLSGEHDLTEYVFNKKVIHHLFCRVCGAQPFARGSMPDGTPTIAVNARCLPNVDLALLAVTPFNGKDI